MTTRSVSKQNQMSPRSRARARLLGGFKLLSYNAAPTECVAQASLKLRDAPPSASKYVYVGHGLPQVSCVLLAFNPRESCVRLGRWGPALISNLGDQCGREQPHSLPLWASSDVADLKSLSGSTALNPQLTHTHTQCVRGTHTVGQAASLLLPQVPPTPAQAVGPWSKATRWFFIFMHSAIRS